MECSTRGARENAGGKTRRYKGLSGARTPERGTSGSVQRGPANPARPGREQRYRGRLGCRRSPEVPRTESFQSSVVSAQSSFVRVAAERGGVMSQTKYVAWFEDNPKPNIFFFGS